MYGALRYVEAHGGSRIVSIGRREVVEMYLRSGLKPVGLTVKAGAVTYDLLEAGTEEVPERMKEFRGLLQRMEGRTARLLDFPFRHPPACFPPTPLFPPPTAPLNLP